MAAKIPPPQLSPPQVRDPPIGVGGSLCRRSPQKSSPQANHQLDRRRQGSPLQITTPSPPHRLHRPHQPLASPSPKSPPTHHHPTAVSTPSTSPATLPKPPHTHHPPHRSPSSRSAWGTSPPPLTVPSTCPAPRSGRRDPRGPGYFTAPNTRFGAGGNSGFSGNGSEPLGLVQHQPGRVLGGSGYQNFGGLSRAFQPWQAS